MQTKSAIIVGAGLGSLATALRLTSKGYQVDIIEKNSQPGGRLNQLKINGFTFDVGPSFFSMPYEFEALVKDCGIAMPFDFVELDPLYTVHFKGNDKKFVVSKDINQMSQQFAEVEPDFANKLTAYLRYCEQLYNDTVQTAIKRNFNGFTDYILALLQVNPKHLPILIKSFWKQIGTYFNSQEARQVISLIAFFLGRTPFDTNAVYTLLSHIEFKHSGYYNVKGGMYTIVNSLVDELLKRGVRFHYNTEIVDFTGTKKQLNALIDQKGHSWKADIFVINSDAAVFRGRVFKRSAFSEKRLSKMSWTMGYLTFYIGINTKLPQVEHHNYYLGNNFEAYAEDVMKNPGILEQPYYYVNVLSKHNPDCAPDGCEALFFVCPVPNLLYKAKWTDKNDIVTGILTDFSKRIDEDITDKIIAKEIYTPENWQDQFNLYKGAGLGLSHTMLQIGAFRPKNQDEAFSNTFYVGSSTVPGAGLPMAIISSKLVTERIVSFNHADL